MQEFISQNCSFYLDPKNSDDFVYYHSLSGIGFNKLGLFRQCIKNSANQYYLINAMTTTIDEFGTMQNKKFMSGICFNKACSANDLQYALKAVQTYVPLFFTLENIQTPSQIKPEFDWMTILAFSIFLLLIGLALISSILDWTMKKRKIKNQLHMVEVFSIFTTLKMIATKNDHTTDRIKIFSGLKVISLLGIMLSHIALIAYTAPTTDIEASSTYLFIIFYFVDVWLMISGFFLSYLLLKQYFKHKSQKILILKIIRRFLRLWPLYIISIFFNWKILPYLGEGPLWPLIINYPQSSCNAEYARYIFMISNLWPSDCYNWLWLFEVDIQLTFILTPFLLLYVKFESKRFRIFFYGVQFAAIVGSIILKAFLQTDVSFADYFFKTEYSGVSIWPITRCGGYLIGFNLGILFYQFRRMEKKSEHFFIRIFKNHKIRPYLKLIPAILIGLIMYRLNQFATSIFQFKDFLFLSSLHTIFPLLVCLMILPSLCGYSSPVKLILESNICNFLSKLSLSFYSVHYSFAIYFIYNRESDLELNQISAIVIAACCFLPSLFLAILFTTLVQIPVFIVKKIFWKTERITYFEH